jgi:hypothetical protein
MPGIIHPKVSPDPQGDVGAAVSCWFHLLFSAVLFSIF